MGESIEEQIQAILKRAPTIEDYLAPFRDRIAELEKQLPAAKTNPKRRAINRELHKLRIYVRQKANRNRREKEPSPRQLRRDKTAEKNLRWLLRKEEKNRRA